MNAPTLADARQQVADGKDTGVICPACDQYARTYSRRLHSTIARALIALYRAGGDDTYIHGPSLPGDTHELSTAARWDLITEEKITRPDGGRAGFYVLTERGRRFVLRGESISEYVEVYNGETVGFTGDNVSITACLGRKFDYADLMTGI